MNKYERQMTELKEEYDEERKKYSSELERLNNAANVACHKYNDQIHAINSLRQSLQTEISELYHFLKRFGNIGQRITPFEYVTEDSRFVNNANLSGTLENKNDQSGTSGFIKTATVTSIIVAPMALPAIWIGDTWLKRSKSKQALQEMQEDYEKQKTQWEKQKRDKRAEEKFYQDATKIADTYRALVATVSMAIKETILPELTGIDAFMIADAIKNSIISDMDPADAEVANVAIYQGSVYDMHYTFVKNAFDYYTTIVAFFTEPILTNIVMDNKVTNQEKQEFQEKVTQINLRTRELEEQMIFGGAV